MAKLSLGVIGYYLWLERNKRIFSNETRNTKSILVIIKNNVKERAYIFKNITYARGDNTIIRKWGLP